VERRERETRGDDDRGGVEGEVQRGVAVRHDGLHRPAGPGSACGSSASGYGVTSLIVTASIADPCGSSSISTLWLPLTSENTDPLENFVRCTSSAPLRATTSWTTAIPFVWKPKRAA